MPTQILFLLPSLSTATLELISAEALRILANRRPVDDISLVNEWCTKNNVTHSSKIERDGPLWKCTATLTIAPDTIHIGTGSSTSGKKIAKRHAYGELKDIISSLLTDRTPPSRRHPRLLHLLHLLPWMVPKKS